MPRVRAALESAFGARRSFIHAASRPSLKFRAVRNTRGGTPFARTTCRPTVDEKKRVLERAREATPREKVFLAGTGAESAFETIALTRWAAALGADYAIVVTPHYNRRAFAPQSLIEHYHRVADESGIPIVLYHIPPAPGSRSSPRRSRGSPSIPTSPASRTARATSSRFRKRSASVPRSSRSSVRDPRAPLGLPRARRSAGLR